MRKDISKKNHLIMTVQCTRSSLVAISSTLKRSKVLETWLAPERVTKSSTKTIGEELLLIMMISTMIRYLNQYKMTLSTKRSI